MRLNLGCGPDRREGCINVDRDRRFRPDVLFDLDKTPWPFRDESFDDVLALDVLEHLADPLSAMAEVSRVLRPGGRAIVRVPHARSRNAVNDWSHRHTNWDREKMEWIERTPAWVGPMRLRLTAYTEHRPVRSKLMPWKTSGKWGNIKAVYTKGGGKRWS